MSRGPVPRWVGRVSADGTRIDLTAKTTFRRWLQTKAGKLVWLTVQEPFKRRSLNQNAFYWAVVVPMIAERCGYLPHEHEAVHDELMRVLLGVRPDAHPLLPIRQSSSALTTSEFNTLIANAQVFAADKLGLVIPDPDAEYAFRRKTDG